MEIKNKLTIDQNSSILRYMDLPKLLDFLRTGSFHFTRLDNFIDKSEAISQRQLAKYLKYIIEVPDSNKMELDLDTRQKRYFALCWFSANRESFGMWNSYSNTSSVALKISFGNFNSLWIEKNLKFSPSSNWIDSIHINKISYKDYLSELGVEGFKDEVKIMGFQKDESFSHEKEIRVLIKCKGKIKIVNKIKYLKNNPILYFRVIPKNIKSISLQIIFHPMMEEWQKVNIKDLVKTYGYEKIQCIDSEVSKLLIPILTTKM